MGVMGVMGSRGILLDFTPKNYTPKVCKITVIILGGGGGGGMKRSKIRR